MIKVSGSDMPLDFAQIPDAWPVKERFVMPDWDVIVEWENKQGLPKSQLDAFYTEAAIYWLRLLADELNPNYHLRQSKNFLVLTSQPYHIARASVQLLESTYEAIKSAWSDIVDDSGDGPLVALIFEDAADYQDYVGQHYPDNTDFSNSLGLFLSNTGYYHIAVSTSDLHQCSSVIFHEMAHYMVSHLALPLWVDEGIATGTERILAQYSHPLLDERMADRHRAYWNAERIQAFWTGASFHESGAVQELSYNLAEVLAEHMRQLPGFKEFLKNCNWQDAGNAASWKYFGGSVGNIAAIFLGDGDWDPVQVQALTIQSEWELGGELWKW